MEAINPRLSQHMGWVFAALLPALSFAQELEIPPAFSKLQDAFPGLVAASAQANECPSVTGLFQLPGELVVFTTDGQSMKRVPAGDYRPYAVHPKGRANARPTSKSTA